MKARLTATPKGSLYTALILVGHRMEQPQEFNRLPITFVESL